MSNLRILIADNDAEYLATVTEFLQRQGYPVVPARTIVEAQAVLEKGSVDFAVIDIRMKDNGDLNDTSGLMLVINVAPQIPKIIVTAFPQFSYVRDALRSADGKLPPVTNFLDKGEGVEKLLESVKNISLLRNVFVVHGHDDNARLEVENFLRQLHLNPVILQDRPHEGQLILEKLEQSAGVAFAIVLLTPDDQCELKNEAGKLEQRARQNVILELGYFMGKLGRRRVCALYKKDTVLPSDIHGFLWINMDHDGAWKMALAREMRIVGIDLDLNDLLLI